MSEKHEYSFSCATPKKKCETQSVLKSNRM